jgi:hypothetical protein
MGKIAVGLADTLNLDLVGDLVGELFKVNIVLFSSSFCVSLIVGA